MVLAEQRTLPVSPALSGVLPTGLRRGTTVYLAGPCGATSLLLGLLAGASADGAWCALVGMPDVGPEAAAAAGVDLGRLAWVPDPGERWPTVVSILLEGLDIVAVGLGGPVRPRVVEARRLVARARQAGSVLMVSGEGWPEGPDLTLEVSGGRWEGLGQGYGSLLRRRLSVSLGGRRSGRRRQADLWLPGGSGAAEEADEVVVELPAEGRP